MHLNDLSDDMQIWFCTGFASKVQPVAIGTHDARSRLEVDATAIGIIVGRGLVREVFAEQHEVAASLLSLHLSFDDVHADTLTKRRLQRVPCHNDRAASAMKCCTRTTTAEKSPMRHKLDCTDQVYKLPRARVRARDFHHRRRIGDNIGTRVLAELH